MDEKVKKYLEERNNAILKEKQDEKSKMLIALGLYNEKKVFAEPKLESMHYPYVEYDKDTDNYFYVDKVAVEVSDAEFAEICKVAPEKEQFVDDAISLGKESSLKNWGTFFVVIGILDLIGGIVLGISGENWGYAIAGISCFFTCMIINVFVKVVANISVRVNEINEKVK